MAAGAGLTEMNAAGFQGKPLYKGIVDEIFREMIDRRACSVSFCCAHVL